jgi:hypothetical protein
MGVMSVQLGSGEFRYEPVEEWESLPSGARLIECPGVAVDDRDQVYVLTRNVEFPVLVFNREGDFLRTWGQGIFSARTHGISISPDGHIFCVDDGTHTVTKFTPEGELVVTVRPAHGEGGRLRLEFSVRDTGRGIPEQVMGTLFDAFRRRVKPGEYVFSSAGLGLSICRKLVAAMNGRLWVESNGARGSAFVVELPRAT